MALELGSRPKAAQIAEALVNVGGVGGMVTCVRGSFGRSSLFSFSSTLNGGLTKGHFVRRIRVERVTVRFQRLYAK